MSSQDSFKSLKLLSLDGGGVRGLASLLILDNLMRRINPDNPPKPCEFFDLIGGTSTGGLIAIMLGPLEMDVQSCINAYVELSKQVFVHKKSSWRIFTKALDRYRMKERFDSAKLEGAIVKIIEAQGKSKDMMIFDEKNPYPKCKAFVCVTLKSNAQNTCFRNYNSPRGIKSNCKLWEACRATSAASSFFDPISIGKLGEYVDGATGRNNPVNQVLEEARDIWPDADQRIQCFISIGTGQPGFQKYGNNLIEVVKTLKSIATETERTAEAFLKAHPELRQQNRYFRFNVSEGLQAIGLDESKKMAEMSQAAHVYLESEGVRVEMEECVKSLRASSFSIIHRPRQNQTIFKTNEDFAEKYESIRSWLGPPTYDYDYPRIKAHREPNTCKWIFERDQLSGWIDGSSRFLWIHGKPGCGKSVIASTIVETVEIEYCTSIDPWGRHLGYVFCDKTDASKRNSLAVMKILVWQIISREDLQPSQKQIILAAWKATSNIKSLSKDVPNNTEDGHFYRLFELFKQLITVYATYSVILDGLDECETPESLLRLFLDLLAASPRVRLLLVSQNVNCVSSIILSSSENRPTIEITPSDNHGDISSYVDTRLPRALKLGTSLHSKVRNVLLEKAQGMFLWVRLAMSQLETATKAIRVTEARLLEVVQEFPKKLDGLYLYILDRILRDDEEGLEEDNAARKQDVCRVLEIVLWSFRPLRIEELQFALEPNADETALRQISEEESLADFKAKISSLCAPLLLFQENNTVTVVHSTFKVFMEAKVGNYPTFKDLFQPEMVHCRIAAACIQYLRSEVFRDFIWFNRPHDRTIDDLFAFKSYATQYWWLHLGQLSLGDGDNYQEMSEQLRDFLTSDQAITWIESCFNMYNSSTSFRYIYLGIKSNLQGWVVPLGMDEWDIQLFQKGTRLRIMQESEDDSKIHMAINHLLAVCEFSGHVEYAQTCIVQFLSTKRLLRGDQHPGKSTLKLMKILARIYIDQHLWEEAEEILLQVVDAGKRLLGKEHTATLMAIENLAIVYHQLGQFFASGGLAQQLLDIRKRLLGEEHPDTLRVMENLARTYRRGGLFLEAEELQRSLLDIKRKLLGDEHPDTLKAMENLAGTYYTFNLFRQAGELQRSLLDIKKRLLGEEHLDTLRAMENLASTYNRHSAFWEAGELQRSLLDIKRRLLGDEHPDTLKAMENLAGTYCTLNLFRQAGELQRSLLDIKERLLGEEHLDTLRAMENLC